MEQNKENDDNNVICYQNSRVISDYNKKRFLSNPSKFWNLFYKNNTTNFFKDRHWTVSEFQDLQRIFDDKCTDRKYHLLEVGCGVGNFMFPLITIPEIKDKCYFYACDYSDNAVNLVKQNPLYDEQFCKSFVCDISQDQSLQNQVQSIDLVSMIFVLSAIQPKDFVTTLKNVYSVLKEGGRVLFRDYAEKDFAQLRFHQSTDPKRIESKLYLRQDGTLSYFFDLQELQNLFTLAGFKCVQCQYVYSRTVNVKQKLDAQRKFVQAVFEK